MDAFTPPLPPMLHRHPARPLHQAGLSLVELMISITIGLLLLAGISMLFVQQNSSRTELEKSSRQIESGRYAMEILRDDIEHAGFYGEYDTPDTMSYTTPAPCAVTMSELGTPIYGYTKDDTAPACVTDRKPDTAILVVRRASAAIVPYSGNPLDPFPTAVAGISYLQSISTDRNLAVMTTPNPFTLTKKDGVTLADLRQFLVRIYYIRTCSVCSPSSDGIPTLTMVENGGTPVPLVEGIENMQFDYGVNTKAFGTDDDGSPNTYNTDPTSVSYTPAPSSSSKWADVMTVRVNLLARNNEPTAGYTDTKSYTLGSLPVSIAAADKVYKRHVYSELVRAINPSGRREK